MFFLILTGQLTVPVEQLPADGATEDSDQTCTITIQDDLNIAVLCISSFGVVTFKLLFGVLGWALQLEPISN